MPGREIIAGQRYAGDDGSADPRVAAALTAYAAGQVSEHAALSALAASRLLIPVVAVAPDPGPGGGGRAAEVMLATLVGTDGRPAVLAFTCLDALTQWRADARPVPVPADEVWQAGAAEAEAVVIDVAGPVPLAVDGPRLAALAARQPPPLPCQDPEVAAAAAAAIAAEPVFTGFRLGPGGDGTDLTLRLAVGTGHDPARAEVADAIVRAAGGLMTAVAGRLARGIEVEVAEGPAECCAG